MNLLDKSMGKPETGNTENPGKHGDSILNS